MLYKYKWDRMSEDLKKYNETPITIIRPLSVPDEADEEVGPMFRVMFEDGTRRDVFIDEIERV